MNKLTINQAEIPPDGNQPVKYSSIGGSSTEIEIPDNYVPKDHDTTSSKFEDYQDLVQPDDQETPTSSDPPSQKSNMMRPDQQFSYSTHPIQSPANNTDKEAENFPDDDDSKQEIFLEDQNPTS